MNYINILQQDVAAHKTDMYMSYQEQLNIATAIAYDAMKLSEAIREAMTTADLVDDDFFKVGGTD